MPSVPSKGRRVPFLRIVARGVLHQCCIDGSKKPRMSSNVVNAKFFKTLGTPVFMLVPEPLFSLGVRGVGSSNLPVPTIPCFSRPDPSGNKFTRSNRRAVNASLGVYWYRSSGSPRPPKEKSLPTPLARRDECGC